jgi:hypothetical protein
MIRLWRKVRSLTPGLIVHAAVETKINEQERGLSRILTSPPEVTRLSASRTKDFAVGNNSSKIGSRSLGKGFSTL